MKRFAVILVVLFAAVAAGVTVNMAMADGTETLGAPSIPIAAGTGIIVEGTGLFSQPVALT